MRIDQYKQNFFLKIDSIFLLYKGGGCRYFFRICTQTGVKIEKNGFNKKGFSGHAEYCKILFGKNRLF